MVFCVSLKLCLFIVVVYICVCKCNTFFAVCKFFDNFFQNIFMPVFKLRRIREIAAKQGISERRLSALAGLSYSAVPEMIKRNSALPSTILKVAKALKIDVSELYAQDDDLQDLTAQSRNLLRQIAQEMRSTLSFNEPEGAIPMLTLDMFFNEEQTLSKVLDTEISDNLKKYVLPHVARADFLIPMAGQTMNPLFKPGDVLICQYLDKPLLGVELGVPYFIETTKGFYFRLIQEYDGKSIYCASPNEKYPPFMAGWEYIISLSRIVGSVRLI